MVKTPRELYAEREKKAKAVTDKLGDKAGYIKALKDYPISFIDNPLAQRPKRRIHTGTALDRILSRKGGIEEGRSIEIYGEYATGKTQICEAVAAEAEGLIIYIDAEDTWFAERFAEICTARDKDPIEVASRLRLYTPRNWIEQEATIKQLPDFDPETGEYIAVGAVILDSIMQVWSDDRRWHGREKLTQRQQLIRAQLKDLCSYVKDHRAILLYTNQVYIEPIAKANRSIEQIYKARGGPTLEHIADYRILLRKGPRNLRWARLVDSPDIPLTEVPFILHKSGIADIEDPGERIRALERGEAYGLKFLDTKMVSVDPAKKYYIKALMLGMLSEEEALERKWLTKKQIDDAMEEINRVAETRLEEKMQEVIPVMSTEEEQEIDELLGEENK